MRLKNKTIFAAIASIVICCLWSISAHAQNYSKNYFANIDWQFNAPLGNNFTSKASGWGMNFEGGMYLSQRIGVGLFLSYSTNHKELPTETINISSNTMLHTNQQRSFFQMPFGASFRYKITESHIIDPYVSLKLGTQYSQISSYISTYQIYDRNWGFYMSPEIGTLVWLTSAKNVGLHLSVYYSFSTNKGTVLNGDIDNPNNMGFRVGLGF